VRGCSEWGERFGSRNAKRARILNFGEIPEIPDERLAEGEKSLKYRILEI
jgi:hypothetical protein